MSVFKSWAPGDVFGEDNVNNNSLNNIQYNINERQQYSRDEPISQSVKAFENWSPEAIFGECPSYQPVNDNNPNNFVTQQPRYDIPIIQSNNYISPKKPKPNTSPELDIFNQNQINFNQNSSSSKPLYTKPISQPQFQLSPHPPIQYYNDRQQMEVLNSYDNNNPIYQSIQQPTISEENLPPDERPIKPMKQMNNIFKPPQQQQQQQLQQPISPLICNTDNTDYPPRKSNNPSPSPGKKYLFNSDYPPHQSPYKSPSPKKSFLFHNNNNKNNNKRIKTPVITDEDLETHLNYSFDKPLHLADSSKYPIIKSKKPPSPTPLYDNEEFNEYQSPIQSPPSQIDQNLYQPSPPKEFLPEEQQQQQYYHQNDEIENEIKPSFEISEKKKKKKKKLNKSKSPNKGESISAIRNALEEERKKMKAIIAIQSLYRMRKERKKYKDVIQRRVKKTKKINMKKRKKAAIIIQRAYRRHLQLLYEAILRARKRHVKCGNCGSTEANGLYCKKCGYRIKQNAKKKDNKPKVKGKINAKPKTILPKINAQTKGEKVNKKDDRKLNNSPIQVPKSYKAIRNEVKSYKKKY